ncbi:aminoglycoside phosphotransferase family protein [Methylomonas sp. AM2-LC]|uniref:phosphotransferase enzyme family protein n=1 Tax=Methylomonas sp. AM2-LC TaxID=3153301 RepID=UPI003265AEEC
MNPNINSIALQFSASESIKSINPLGNGLINDTYQVNTSSNAFVLQRINEHVFPNPEQIMANLQKLSQHIRLQSSNAVRLKIPAIILTNQQKSFFKDTQQQYWRALEFIHPAESREQLHCQAEAEQVGFALAHFHQLCSELATENLYDTLPGFHITPHYYQQYVQLPQANTQKAYSAEINYCQQFIHHFRDKIDVLENAKIAGELKQRIIHGDPKLNNFLFEPDSHQIISLIDLDTVKPGLIHYDIGDCLRSCCYISETNHFDLDCCESILRSYLQEAKLFFSDADYAYLFSAIQLIPFELGLRFFSDYLVGNPYFKVSYPEQNLSRALAQFQLTAHISHSQLQIENMLANISKR